MALRDAGGIIWRRERVRTARQTISESIFYTVIPRTVSYIKQVVPTQGRRNDGAQAFQPDRRRWNRRFFQSDFQRRTVQASRHSVSIATLDSSVHVELLLGLEFVCDEVYIKVSCCWNVRFFFAWQYLLLCWKCVQNEQRLYRRCIKFPWLRTK